MGLQRGEGSEIKTRGQRSDDAKGAELIGNCRAPAEPRCCCDDGVVAHDDEKSVSMASFTVGRRRSLCSISLRTNHSAHSS